MNMNRRQEQIKFLNDVRSHQMTIINDDGGVCRTIRFMQPNTSNRYFDITTWPDHLCISGDMGTYVFSRLRDMFEFFRSDKLYVNYSDWGEKLEAVGKYGGYMEFESEYVLDSIKKRIGYLCDEFIPDLYEDLDNYTKSEYPSIEIITKAFKEDAIEHFENADLDEYRHASEIDDWESNVFPKMSLHGYEGNDWDYEWLSSKRMSWHYKWCCHAIAWAVKQYDRHQQPIVIPSHYQAVKPCSIPYIQILGFEEDRELELFFGDYSISLERDPSDDGSHCWWYMRVDDEQGNTLCDGWIDDSSALTAIGALKMACSSAEIDFSDKAASHVLRAIKGLNE